MNSAEPVILFSSHPSDSADDLPGVQIAAAFVFTRGKIVEQIPYDPFMYFHGEEQNFSVRAFTHGWDIWHPNAVPLNHLYKHREELEPALHWDETLDKERDESWRKLKARSDKRLARIFNGEDLGVYGLGNERSFEQYLDVAKLSWTPTTLSEFSTSVTISVT